MSPDLLNLPFAVQASLGVGYAAYCLAFAGRRYGHGPQDAIFLSLLFGALAWAVAGMSKSVLGGSAGAVAAGGATATTPVRSGRPRGAATRGPPPSG